MLRLKQTLRGAIASLILVFSISTASIIPLGLTVGVTTLTVTQTACGPDTLSKLHDTLNKTAKSFEAAIDTNGRLYQGGIYGPVGSATAIGTRQRVATIIHDGNESLIKALTIAKGLTKETFESGKLAVLQALSAAAATIGTTGNQTMDLVLQATAAFINQAVTLIQAFSSRVINELPQATPVIDNHIKAFEKIAEDALL